MIVHWDSLSWKRRLNKSEPVAIVPGDPLCQNVGALAEEPDGSLGAGVDAEATGDAVAPLFL